MYPLSGTLWHISEGKDQRLCYAGGGKIIFSGSGTEGYLCMLIVISFVWF